jgi:hypothetical protein
MIANPTLPQLLQTVKAELTDKITPALSDPTHVVAVGMMTALLDALSIRAENEIAWMHAEAGAVEAAATTYAEQHPDATAVVDALAELARHDPAALTLSAVRARYEAAGDVLSALADAAYAVADPAGVNAVERLVQQRLDTELAIVGSFVAVGRE